MCRHCEYVQVQEAKESACKSRAAIRYRVGYECVGRADAGATEQGDGGAYGGDNDTAARRGADKDLRVVAHDASDEA